MVAFSPCKINIGLDIVAKRPDGYHDIVTAMVPVPWYDIVEIVPDETTHLTVLGRQVDCPPEKNLVMKAYRAVAGSTPIACGTHHTAEGNTRWGRIGRRQR